MQAYTQIWTALVSFLKNVLVALLNLVNADTLIFIGYAFKVIKK